MNKSEKAVNALEALGEGVLPVGALEDAILGSARLASIVTDAKGIIRIFNAGAEHLLGYPAAEVLNRLTPADLCEAPVAAAGFEELVRKAASGIEDLREAAYIGKDRGRVPSFVWIAALRGADGEIVGYLFLCMARAAGAAAGKDSVAEPAANGGAPHAVAPAPAPAPARLRTLLYVEDNPANLTLVEQIIARRTDVSLLSAVNGKLGVELARSSLPDVILMDINLPEMNGIEALKALRADPATAGIPIVALSANAMARDIEKGLAAGFFRYLTKPIKVVEFMETLDQALEFARKYPRGPLKPL